MSSEDGGPRPRRYLLHAALFLATFITTTAAGALFAHNQGLGSDLAAAGARGIRPISDGLSYSIPLLLILVCHEFGHFFAARAHGVDASLPYFIPLPPGLGLGTLGAVIGMRNVTSDRRKLIDIGAAGPLAGLLVAVPVILYGLSLSRVGPLATTGLQEGNSLLYALLRYAAKGTWLPDGQRDVYLHPTAWAGWAGLLVTMINLLPIGQLDGGHIATAYFGNRYNRFSTALHRALPLFGVVVFLWVLRTVSIELGDRWNRGLGVSVAMEASLPWLMWFAMVALVKRMSGEPGHPPVEEQPLPASRKALFWVVVAVFLAIFMPVPFRTTFGTQPAKVPTAARADVSDHATLR